MKQNVRNRMSYSSEEMALKGFRGVGTVWRHEGENFIVLGRDAEALRLFWKAVPVSPGFEPDEAKYKKSIIISDSSLSEPTPQSTPTNAAVGKTSPKEKE